MLGNDACREGCDPRPFDGEADLRCARCGRVHRYRARPAGIRVAFWNKWNWTGPDRLLAGLGRAAPGWDVMLLVECTERDVTRLAEVYGTEQVASVFHIDDAVDRARDKPHGAAVVVRNGLRIESSRLTLPWGGIDDPKGDKSLTIEVEAPFGTCTFLAAHVMNGGDGVDGWERKLRTYERLDAELSPANQPWPVVVGMDGNVWEDHLDAAPEPDPAWHAQKQFQSDWAGHHLRDTLRTAIASDPDRAAAARERLDQFDGLVGTYQQTATVTRFDRIYVSPDVEVLDAGVDPVGLELSDHAIVWADLLLPATTTTTDPDIQPQPRQAKRELGLDDVAQAVLRDDSYGWNRRGYLARVALASLSDRGFADAAFIRDHYPGHPAPHRRWSGARRSTNQSWNTLGEGRFGAKLVHYDTDRKRHWMDAGPARVVADVLGITDLVDRVDAPELEQLLAERLRPGDPRP